MTECMQWGENETSCDDPSPNRFSSSLRGMSATRLICFEYFETINLTDRFIYSNSRRPSCVQEQHWVGETVGFALGELVVGENVGVFEGVEVVGDIVGEVVGLDVVGEELGSVVGAGVGGLVVGALDG